MGRTSRAEPVKPGAFAAVSATDRPTGTLPVKETKLTAGCSMVWAVSSGSRCRTERRCGGRPARVRARERRSAVRGVWGEGLRRTALPAMSAGRRELIVVRYGKLYGVSGDLRGKKGRGLTSRER